MSISATVPSPRQLQEIVRDILAASSFFPEHGVTILLQDEGDIRYEIDKTVEALDAPLIIIAVNEIEPNQPDISADMQLVISENVTANRARANFAAAMDVAWAASLLLDSTRFRVKRISHSLESSGLARAVVDFQY